MACCRGVAAAQDQTHEYSAISVGSASIDPDNIVTDKTAEAGKSCDTCGALCDADDSCAYYVCGTFEALSTSYGKHCVGNYIQTTAANSDACRELCRESDSCVAFTYIDADCASKRCELMTECDNIATTGCTGGTYVSEKKIPFRFHHFAASVLHHM